MADLSFRCEEIPEEFGYDDYFSDDPVVNLVHKYDVEIEKKIDSMVGNLKNSVDATKSAPELKNFIENNIIKSVVNAIEKCVSMHSEDYRYTDWSDWQNTCKNIIKCHHYNSKKKLIAKIIEYTIAFLEIVVFVGISIFQGGGFNFFVVMWAFILAVGGLLVGTGLEYLISRTYVDKEMGKMSKASKQNVIIIGSLSLLLGLVIVILVAVVRSIGEFSSQDKFITISYTLALAAIVAATTFWSNKVSYLNKQCLQYQKEYVMSKVREKIRQESLYGYVDNMLKAIMALGVKAKFEKLGANNELFDGLDAETYFRNKIKEAFKISD